MNISATDARALFVTMLIGVYKERIRPKSFLRSFFPVIESPTKNIAIEVSRGKEPVAVDVLRGSDANRNSWSKSTVKIFSPPYFHEKFDATELDLYDRMFGSAEVSSEMFAAFLASAADKVLEIQDMIERAYELQCSQALLDGIVQVKAGLNIDYNRKAASLVNINTATGSYWTANGHDVYKDIEDGCIFLRTVGKCQGGTFNIILGDLAFAALKNNSVFKAANNLFNLRLDQIRAPQRDSTGGALHGQLTCGSYLVNVWTYPEYHDDILTNVSTPYVDPKKFILLPENPNFNLSFAAVPQLLKEGAMPIKGAFLVSEYLDEKLAAHEINIKSAGLAVIKAVDQIYTAQAVA